MSTAVSAIIIGVPTKVGFTSAECSKQRLLGADGLHACAGLNSKKSAASDFIPAENIVTPGGALRRWRIFAIRLFWAGCPCPSQARQASIKNSLAMAAELAEISQKN
mmetsp:Transcript_122877/g.223289  ORF Transcript_122877/g.223289 Transcript_122877/m.223289 type:complete len:107 (+) Transcript_122877:742-1062(+)